jgi:hypothetical protein
VVLIHPNITGHKLEFEKRLLKALRGRAWFGTLREFGAFWAARDQVSVDVARDGARLQVSLHAPLEVTGLGLHLPQGYRVTAASPALKYRDRAGHVVIARLSGDVRLTLERD